MEVFKNTINRTTNSIYQLYYWLFICKNKNSINNFKRHIHSMLKKDNIAVLFIISKI